MSATGVKTPTPALLMRMSMPPKCAAAAANARSTSSYVRTFAVCAIASAPSCRRASCSGFSFVPVIITWTSLVTSARAIASPMPREPPVTIAVFPLSVDMTTGRIPHRIMATVAIVGAGDVGGACAHALAAHDLAGHILLIDAAVNAAAGKALDIQQAGAISGVHARLEATDDESRAIGCAAFVIADRFAAGSPEWQGEEGLALIRRLAGSSPDSPIVFAGTRQTGLIEASSREARVPARRLIGSAIEALARVISQVQLRRIEARVARLWPPGPYALGAAAARLVEAMLQDSRKSYNVETLLGGEFGVRDRVGVVPALLASDGVAHTRVPALNTRERVQLDIALGA